MRSREAALIGRDTVEPGVKGLAVHVVAAGTDGSFGTADDLVTDVLPLEAFAEGLARYRSGAALKVAFAPYGAAS